MNRKLVYALVLLAVTVVVLLFNRQSAEIRLLPRYAVEMSAAFAYLIFAAVGMVTGLLLRG